MKRHSIEFATVVFVVIGIGFPLPGQARGFCNVDHIGSEDQQESVRLAAAQFYTGVEHAMAMLAAFERGERSETAARAEESIGAFEGASESYQSSSKLFSDAKLELVDPSLIAALAQTKVNSSVEEIFTLGQRDPVMLLARCSDESENMRQATAALSEHLFGEMSTSKASAYLRQLSRTLYIGRIVSSFFAASGGERP